MTINNGLYVSPAKILVSLIVLPNVNFINNMTIDIKDVDFICLDVDIAPLFE